MAYVLFFIIALTGVFVGERVWWELRLRDNRITRNCAMSNSQDQALTYVAGMSRSLHTAKPQKRIGELVEKLGEVGMSLSEMWFDGVWGVQRFFAERSERRKGEKIERLVGSTDGAKIVTLKELSKYSDEELLKYNFRKFFINDSVAYYVIAFPTSYIIGGRADRWKVAEAIITKTGGGVQTVTGEEVYLYSDIYAFRQTDVLEHHVI